MPSKKVPLVNNEIYHVYNRGVDKRKIFQDKKDYLRFYNCLFLFNTDEAAINYRLARGPVTNEQRLVSVISYCLLPNHFHLILKQKKDGGVGEYMRRLSLGYTGFFNEKYERTGALFQGTFKRCHVANDEYFNYLFAYVNQNYLVHGIKQPEDICYCSTSHFSDGAPSRVLNYHHPIPYDSRQASLLAREIRNKRLLAKSDLFE